MNKKFLIKNGSPINEESEKKIIEIYNSYFSLNINLNDLFENTFLYNLDKITLKILKSKNLGTQWYKCPKGHLYIVGECGRPTEESVCPECNSQIGGLDHNPTIGNERFNINQIIQKNSNFSYSDSSRNLKKEIMNDLERKTQVHEMDDDIRDLINNNQELNDYN